MLDFAAPGRLSRIELAMTEVLESSIAPAAMIGFNNPVMANPIPAML